MQIDAAYTPKPVERKVLFGMTLEQKRNDGKIDENLFSNIVTKRQDVRYTAFILLFVLKMFNGYDFLFKQIIYICRSQKRLNVT